MDALVSYLSQSRNREKKIECKDRFGCNETLTESLYTAVKKKLNLSGKDWENMVKLMNKHPVIKQITRYPIRKDVGEDKAFAREVA